MLRFLRILKNFKQNTSAVAAIEFAFIMPVLLLLYFGSVDLAQAIIADRKLSNLTATIGDLTAQSRIEVSRGTLNTYFSASEIIMTPYDLKNLKMRVAIVEVASNGTTKVLTMHPATNPDGIPNSQRLTLNRPYPNLSSEIISAAKGIGYAVISDGWYEYKPLLGYVFKQNIPLNKQYYFSPRSQELIKIIN